MGAHAYPARRLEFVDLLHEICENEFRVIYAGCPLVVAGSCLSDKEHPGDVECTFEARWASENVRQRALMHWFGRHQAIKQLGVDYYPTLTDDRNLRAFFSYLGPKSAALKSLDERHLRGTVLLSEW